MNRRQLEAEELRDAVLAVSGRLDRTMYGPGFQDFVIEKPEHSPHYRYDLYDPEDAASHRRSVYRWIIRSQPQPFLTTLDCADPSILVGKRNQTLTPIQALALLNDRFMLVMAKDLCRSPATNRRRLRRADRACIPIGIRAWSTLGGQGGAHRVCPRVWTSKHVPNDSEPERIHVHRLIYGQQLSVSPAECGTVGGIPARISLALGRWLRGHRARLVARPGIQLRCIRTARGFHRGAAVSHRRPSASCNCSWPERPVTLTCSTTSRPVQTPRGAVRFRREG